MKLRLEYSRLLMSEFGIDRALRDALPATIFSGTSEIQRNLIAKHLGL